MAAHLRRLRLTGAAVSVALVTAALSAPAAFAAFGGSDPGLTRAPYLTDLTASSVQVTWATTTQSKPSVSYGPPGNCAATSVASATLANPITVNGVTEYFDSVAVTGLAADTAYCYRIRTGGANPVDLLGSNPSPAFTTLPAANSSPLTFAVFGDWGDTTNSGVNDGSLNVNQANVDALLATSGARFAVTTGDIAYPSGTQTNYGDLAQTGPSISGVFGSSYWAVPGSQLPLYTVSGNHGRSSTFLATWPEARTAAGSNGVYQMVSYPSIDGAPAASYPTSYYAFTAGGVRFYMLDASWGDNNVGSATGGLCGSHCALYQVDHDAHWTASSAEYQWLAKDLAQHPGGVKMATFHFPLRSDDATEPNDAYLLNTPGSVGSLEQLLHDGGVQLVFNGHAHDYQRNVAPPSGVTSYVTGGGGARLTTVGGGGGCSGTDAYAVGWSYTSKKGSACGAATAPTREAQVFHYLKVTVNGTSVSVTPVDSTGQTFDVQTYDFQPDAVMPSAPGSLTATQTSTKVQLGWTAATDNVGVSAYDVYRNGAYLATLSSAVSGYADKTAVVGTGYTYRVNARDLAGNTAGATVSVAGGGGDTSAPTAPATLTATALSKTSISLSWPAASDNVGVTSYTLSRNGIPIAAVGASTTSYADSGLTPGTSYTYFVVASDAAGNLSQASPTATAITNTDTSPPTVPGSPTATSVTSNAVALAWTASTDDVGVSRYDVLRDGAMVGSSTGTSFTDGNVAGGTTYSYVIRAYDAAGNFAASAPSSVTTPPSGSLFFDGFETGNLSAWTPVSGLSVSSLLAHTGIYAARETSTGSATYAYKTLATPATELWSRAWIYVASRSTSANLFGYRTSGGASIVNAYIDTSGRLSLRNNIGGVTTTSTTTVAPGAWHRVVLHAIVAGTSSSIDVSLDGTPVPGLSLSGQNLGTGPIAKLQLGETATARTYDIALDEVQVSSSALT